MTQTLKKAVFLDRDGTLNEERHYISRSEDMVLLPGVGAALKRLQNQGFKLFIVSNQSGVGRGYFTLSDVDRIHKRLLEELQRDGVAIEKIYVAPEAPGTPSRGRKPSPQFLLDARDEYGLDLSLSFMIGDKLIDLECGWNAGVKHCILVRTGYGAETERGLAGKFNSVEVVNDLAAASDWIASNTS